jgi:hypothetical protein
MLARLAAVVFSLISLAAGPATRPTLTLKLVADGWGEASTKDAEAVFRSAAGTLLPHFEGIHLEPIRVSPRGGPIVLYRRVEGHIDMRLDTTDTRWAQYAFQFSHELCHVLARYREKHPGNQWFEESICELASLYALRAMSEEWKTKPPYPNWKSYGPHLASYAKERMEKAALPEGVTLAKWYAENERALRAKADDRARNQVVATALLPLFEERPGRWRAVYHLNDGAPKTAETFAEYLKRWLEHAPAEHRGFVRAIAGRFEIAMPGEP